MRVKPIAIVILLLFLVGCASAPLTPTGAYYDKLATFNDLVESYDWHYNTLDAEKQTVLKKYVDPVIEEASTALDYWGQSVDDSTRMQTYMAIFSRLQRLLVEYGVGGDV
jgi:hypothetical protein